MKKDIFKGAKEPLPYYYPEAIIFANAIRNSLWLAEEFRDEIKRDVKEYLYVLDDKEKQMVKRCLLAISQIEVNVKRFWGKLFEIFPYTEFEILGSTHGFSESTHFECYSMILQELGLEDEFKKLHDVPCIQGRVSYLEKYLKFDKDNKKSFIKTLILFSEFIEAVSLYSQFYIIRSICHKTQKMKAIDNIVKVTSIEEDCHFQTGAWLVNTILKENPDWMDSGLKSSITKAALKSFEFEKEIINWIFENGSPDYINRDEVIEFLKHRYNKGLKAINFKEAFEVDKNLIKHTDWFETEGILDERNDFFDSHSKNYQFGNRNFSLDNLFDND